MQRQQDSASHLVPLQVGVQHEARLRIRILEQQPLCFRLGAVASLSKPSAERRIVRVSMRNRHSGVE